MSLRDYILGRTEQNINRVHEDNKRWLLFRSGIPFKSDVVSYACAPATDGVLIDKTGDKQADRLTIPPQAFLGNGFFRVQYADYPNEVLTYYDLDLDTIVTSSTDASGDFIVPSTEIAWIEVAGHRIYATGLELTHQDIASTDGEVIVLLYDTYDDYAPTDYRVEAIEDKNGYLVTKALGKNLFNKDGFLNVGMGVSTSSGNLYIDASLTTTDFILIEELTDYAVNYNKFGALYDKNKNYISGIVNDFSTVQDAKFVRYSIDNANVVSFQLEVGTISTAYEPWEGYYKNQALTQTYEDGRIIGLSEGTKSRAWVAPGVLADLDYKGKIGVNWNYNRGSFTANGTDNELFMQSVNDGVIDIEFVYKDTGIIGTITKIISLMDNNASITKWSTGTLLVQFGSLNYAFYQGNSFGDGNYHKYEISIKGNGQNDIDNLVVRVDGKVLTPNVLKKNSEWYQPALNISAFKGFSGYTYNDGSMSYIKTTKDSVVRKWDFNADGDETVKYTIDGVLQPSPTIQGTVLSSQWNDDEIIRSVDPEGTPQTLLAQALQDLNTNPFFNYDNYPNEVTALVAPVDGLANVYETGNEKVFISKEDNGDLKCVLAYNTAKTGDYLDKVYKFMVFLKPLLDGEGNTFQAGNGETVEGFDV